MEELAIRRRPLALREGMHRIHSAVMSGVRKRRKAQSVSTPSQRRRSRVLMMITPKKDPKGRIRSLDGSGACRLSAQAELVALVARRAWARVVTLTLGASTTR